LFYRSAQKWALLFVCRSAAPREPPPASFILLSDTESETMTDIHEKDLANEIDRDIDSGHGMLALLVCLSVTVGLALAGVADLLGAI
jgi:hypothetical protein